MSKFSWTIWLCLSMVSLGVIMLRYAHDPTEILQFTGGLLLGDGLGIPAAGFLLTFRKKK